MIGGNPNSAGSANKRKASITKRRANIRLDMTPMVDIAFLLLIFYMATTQFKPPDARAVTLPGSKSHIDVPAKDIITITVTSADSVFLDFVELSTSGELESFVTRRTTAVNLDYFRKQLLLARSINPNAYIVFKADRQASFGVMQDIMKILQNMECARFLIATDLEPAPEN